MLKSLDGTVDEVRLYDKALPPLSLKEMEIRDAAAKSKDFSSSLFDLPKQFASADTIVFAAPYWDMMFPAVVKNYLETITVNGLTFAYGKNGIPYGMCQAKKVIYVTTAGGPIIRNFGYEYVTALAKGFFGINEVICVKAEGLDIYGADVDSIMENAKKSFN